MIGDGLRAYLLAQSSVTDEVSTRIASVFARQGETFPYVTYQLLGYAPNYSTDGDESISTSAFQLNVVAKTPRECERIGDVLRNVLSGYQGTMGSDNVRRCHIVGKRMLPPVPVHGDEQGYPMLALDIEITHVESTPSV